ncbi:hypothetical protein EOD40_08685 [Flavobacterium sufflavum]|uniref:Uncharacterized protein n=1 Tax=Flavobacterium sufflavum TaxID=1921138 RepID=A0A437KVX8_9FLAO|nr:hypothetical protein [Flavobacterium sufflavum]RVT76570.1 hypothetical protein EOD40_08685 [Flavobacterium sufflavum]
MIEEEINQFIRIHKIEDKIQKSFEYLLYSNASDEIDINSKNISINPKNLKYKLTEINSHSFQTPIINKSIEIGNYTLLYNSEGKLIDDIFVIY